MVFDMETDGLSCASEKIRRSRRLTTSRGLLQMSKKNSTDTNLLHCSRPSTQRMHSDLNVNPGKPKHTINWELNEKISLSSGSSTGIEICPDTKSGIGFMERHKKKTNLTTNQPAGLYQRMIAIQKDTSKSLDLFNISGYPKKTKIQNIRAPMLEKCKGSTNVLRNDSKYEIRVAGECTISRKKRQDRKKVEESKVSSRRNNSDLTGTVRRRWIPANQKIDDSIAKRLELIHELNQKILANYERFQAKSKRTNSKGTIKQNPNSRTDVTNTNYETSCPIVPDMRGNQGHIIYSEIIQKRQKKTDAMPTIEQVMIHCAQEDSLDKNTVDEDNVEFDDNSKTPFVPRVLQTLTPKSTFTSETDDNFSLVKKPQCIVELNSETTSVDPIELKGNKVEYSPVLECAHFNYNTKKLGTPYVIKMNDADNSSGKSGEKCLANSRLYPDSDPNFCTNQWKHDFYSSLNENKGNILGKCQIVNMEMDEKEKATESTESLEKEILDNLNATIGRFDIEKCDVTILDTDANTNVDIQKKKSNEKIQREEETEEWDDDSFSTDSIQITRSTRKQNCQEDVSNQETFNSSWGSSVGVDVGSGSGWVRIHTGIESSLVYLTVDTTSKDVCRDMLLGDELSLYIQYGGEMGRRLGSNERPLVHQNEFLRHLGYEEPSRRARLGVDPELRYLIAFHVGPAEPQSDLMGYSRCGYALILKGLVSPQWKKRALAVIGSRLFLYHECPESRPEWIELEGGAVCHAPSRLGKLVLRVTGFPRISQQKLHQNSEQSHRDGASSVSGHHHESRHLYLGFHHPWDRELWRGWLKQALKSSSRPAKLDLSRSGLSRIPESILAFPATEEISLERNHLGNDNSNLIILHKFCRLRTIQLKHNELKSIPRELLELVNVTSLDLTDNKIKQVPTDIHRLVNSSENILTSTSNNLVVECFKSGSIRLYEFATLQELILDRNEIKSLPNEAGLLKELRIISLADNLLETLPTFLNMRALTLDVLTKGDSSKFEDKKCNRSNLHKVNLRNNQLKGNIILGNYGNLTHLDVSENSIEKLDVSALQELQSARCARNSLTELTLSGRNLVSLIAGHNRLKKLTIEPTPTNLEHLDISYNCLDTLPEWISDLPVLRALFASHNDLTALPDSLLSQPSRLEVLHLPHNRLQALPPPRKPLNIVHLTLQGNALTALPLTFFQNTEKLKVLNLSNNRLCELPYHEDAMKLRCSNSHSLEKLYLTGNCLTDTALDSLAKLSALRVLHLAYNVLDTLPESCIASWPDLEELLLSGNRLQYLPDNVANLRHLRVLRVHSNRLLTCPTFNKTTSLMVLDLAHNQLDRVNLSTLVPPQLQFLDISCNSRLHVDPRQFQVYRSQRPVSLVDVSGQNRPSLPSHPLQQEIVSAEKGPEHPWRLGFSETSGTREKLFISQVRMPSFCNIEGLFGIFDGGTNQEAPVALQEMIPRLLLEEKTIRETSKDYLKYTLLSAHRELKEKGQKYGIDATLIHITKLPSSQYTRAPRRYSLKIASSGETKAVLCRAAGPLILAPPSKTHPSKNQLGNSAMFPLTVPDPTFDEVVLEDDDEFVIIANRKLWEVLTIQEAVREARAEASPVLAAKRLQDLAQAYGAEDNLSIIVVRLTGPSPGDLDQLMRELRHAVTKNRNPAENSCSCPCCVPPPPHKSPTPCCCHSNDGFYLNGVLKNIVNNRSGHSRAGSVKYYKNSQATENISPPITDDRSSPSGQSDQTTDSTFKSRQTSGRAWVGGTALRAATKNRQNMIIPENQLRKEDAVSERSDALSEEQFRCWEYMLEQNTHMLFDKELDTLNRMPLRRGQSRSTPQLANLPFLSKRFGSARSFNPPLPRAPVMRFGSGRRFLNGGPNAAYFGSLQRLMPYNLEYDFAVIQERGGLDSLEQDASRMQQYWGVATTEL